MVAMALIIAPCCFGQQVELRVEEASLKGAFVNTDGIEEIGHFIHRPDLGLMTDEVANAVRLGAHGQFAQIEDQLYACVQGPGLLVTPPDKGKWEKRETQDHRLKLVNGHGMCAFQVNGEDRIAIADDANGKIWIITPAGEILQILDTPKGTEFDKSHVKRYYQMKTGKVPFTGVAFLNGSLWVTTGYDAGDFVLELIWKDGKFQWGSRAFGQKGDGPEDFKTAHGISAVDGLLLVASRHNDSLFELKPEEDGLKLVRIVNLKASETAEGQSGNILVCHDHRFGGYNYFPLLNAHGGRRHASIIIYTEDVAKRVGQLTPGEHSEGLSKMIHVHGVHVFIQKNADGSESLIVACHMWPDSSKDQDGERKTHGGLLFFELVPTA